MSQFLLLMKTLGILFPLMGETFTAFAARTHVIYWDPENVVFQTLPAPLLHVDPRDEVVFVCSHESLYIMWTYERLAMESCSMWLDSRVVVRLLFKCPTITKNTSISSPRRRVKRQVTWTPSTKHGRNSSLLYSRLILSRANRTGPLVEQNQPGSDIRSTGTGSTPDRVRFHANTFEHTDVQIQRAGTLTDRFTLLIDEFAWVNGNPRFALNRPVYFMAQSSLCRTNNMRLAIVNGDYSWNIGFTPLKSNRAADPGPSNCDRETTRPFSEDCDPPIVEASPTDNNHAFSICSPCPKSSNFVTAQLRCAKILLFSVIISLNMR